MPLTLLPLNLAKEGYVFQYLGAAPECVTCKHYIVCQSNLESGRKYEVVRVKDVEHECPLRGDVKVVEVKFAPIKVILPKNIAIRGALVTYRAACSSEKNPLCEPDGLKPGDKIKIVECLESKTENIDPDKIICVVELVSS